MKTPPQAGLVPQREPRAPLTQLKKWPTAWRPDSDCLIDKVVYPAPDSLDAAEVGWWLDYTTMRLDAARSMVNALFGAIVGAAFGVAVGALASSASSDVWAPYISLALGLLVIAVIGALMLRDSDHPGLEQRWLVYRERARRLSESAAEHTALTSNAAPKPDSAVDDPAEVPR